ncbi:MAG: undecaprenyl/decaprenyl-phosphate alpha-N-acetylglucosaminyl 1-phosphate transferase [Endomicrobiales bacterium]|nr:undecaprenyl/decaprenyl-phosphate alpha-N-acetylglucosaminyl 1-phosphate transferase [Endomicrobiales bacterium]
MNIAEFIKLISSRVEYLYFVTVIMSFAIAYALTPVLRIIAQKFGILDHPHSNVKTHKDPTPYLGGIAIWLGWLTSLFIVRLFTHFPSGTLRSLRGIMIGSVVIILLGLIDDILPKGLKFKAKFLIQALAVMALIMFDIRVHFISPYAVALIISLIWVIGITNAFNIIDIMDGLSSGIAVIASLAFLFIALPTEQIYVNFCAAALAGACLGFIPYNLSKKGKIFMGDTGSLTIGFIVAALSMGTSYTKLNDIALLAPILIIWIPMYDTMLVMYMRWKKGMSPFLGSRDHFALRLEKMGFSRTQILIMSYGVAVVMSFGAFLVTRVTIMYALTLLGILAVLTVYITSKLGQVKVD